MKFDFQKIFDLLKLTASTNSAISTDARCNLQKIVCEIKESFENDQTIVACFHQNSEWKFAKDEFSEYISNLSGCISGIEEFFGDFIK